MQDLLSYQPADCEYWWSVHQPTNHKQPPQISSPAMYISPRIINDHPQISSPAMCTSVHKHKQPSLIPIQNARFYANEFLLPFLFIGCKTFFALMLYVTSLLYCSIFAMGPLYTFLISSIG
uniref:Transmembrane protein n=1 Tax=Macrostomum lignano TaxID=282301 RepID=A0A1I8IHL9_9PLAT